MELSLQDFAAEIKVVTAGIDVTSVAKKFRPDIVFADVLLQKKNGYEVAQEMGQDAELKGIPVVLIWSGFMELDEKKLMQCGARAKLEKPFDSEDLRKVVFDLVPKTTTNPVTEFLDFPNITEENLKADIAATVPDQLVSELPPLPEESQLSSESPTTPLENPILTPPPPETIVSTEGPIDEGASAEVHESIPLPPPTASSEEIPQDLPDIPEPLTPSSPPSEELKVEFPMTHEAPMDLEIGAPEVPSREGGEVPQQESSWDMNSFQDINEFSEEVSDGETDIADVGEDFSEVPITQASPLGDEPTPSLENLGSPEELPPAAINESADQSHLGTFELDLPDDTEFDDIEVEFSEPGEKESTQVLLDYLKETGTLDPSSEAHSSPLPPAPQAEPGINQSPQIEVSPIEPPPLETPQSMALPTVPAIDPAQLEAIVSSHVKEIIEKIAQRVVPELAEELIRNELEKLLEENQS
jgi:CheY-like chemotaxis protein